MLFSGSAPTLLRAWRRALAACALLACSAGIAQAAAFTVLLADDSAPHADFVRQLRELHNGSARFDVVRVDAPAPAGTAVAAAPAELAGDDERSPQAGVRTRGLRSLPAAPVADGVTFAVGARAARVAIDRPGNEPLVLAMLSRLEYEDLRALPSLRRADRRVGVLLRDPAMADQLTVAGAALTDRKRRLGLVVTPESEPLLRELQKAAGKEWELQIEYAPDARSLATALRNVLPRSDALMVLPDLIGDNQAATLAVLRAGASAGLPVFGASDGMVRSGGLAAAVSTPQQLAQQARAMAQKLAAAAGYSGSGTPVVEAATPASVRVNATVARGLGLRLPDERELTERVASAAAATR